MMYLFLVPALAAAIWAWRLAEGSKDKLKNDLKFANLNTGSWIKAHEKVCNELAQLSQRHSAVEHDLQDCKQNWVKADEDRNAALQRIEVLDNEITGLNIDKLHLKFELASFREKQQKRREQKAASMRRFRAKNKEAKK